MFLDCLRNYKDLTIFFCSLQLMSDYNLAVESVCNQVDVEIGDTVVALDKLISYLDILIVEDFSAVVNLLYRVDVSEVKVRRKLAQALPGETAGSILAHLLIERELQKIDLRRRYRDGLL